MIGEKDIDIVSMDIKDIFFNNNFIEKLNMLEQGREGVENPPYPTYTKNDVKPVVSERKTSKIKEIFEMIKAKLHTKTKQTDDKDIGWRG